MVMEKIIKEILKKVGLAVVGTVVAAATQKALETADNKLAKVPSRK